MAEHTRDSPNHPPGLVDYSLFTSNAALTNAFEREGAAAAREQLTARCERCGPAWAQPSPGAHVVRAAGYIARMLGSEGR